MALDPNIMMWLYQQQQRAAAQSQADRDKAEAATRASTLRTNATNSARTDATNYFRDRGLDPTRYSGAIDDRINQVLSSTAEDDPNVGSYLSHLGDTVFSGQQDAQRARAGRDVNAMFAPNFESSRIADTADDPILADINTSQRGTADNYIANLLRRHVINDTGATGARANLDRQGSRVRTQLNDLGRGTIAAGRQSLTDIANRARSDAMNSPLGTTFDASGYGNEATQSANDFTTNIGDAIRARVPGNLYDTSGLAAAAGTSQGAQNLSFDPRALAGIIQPDENQNGQATQQGRQRPIF